MTKLTLAAPTAANDNVAHKPEPKDSDMVTRVNLMTGKEYQERRDTPLCCSPASETYWSM